LALRWARWEGKAIRIPCFKLRAINILIWNNDQPAIVEAATNTSAAVLLCRLKSVF
jgi:hypothetical protein